MLNTNPFAIRSSILIVTITLLFASDHAFAANKAKFSAIPDCPDGCVVIEQLASFDIVTAVAPGKNSVGIEVISNVKRQKSTSSKCLLKSGCVPAEEPDESTCNIVRVSCVEIYHRPTYDIIVTWRNWGWDPAIEIIETEEEGEENEDE